MVLAIASRLCTLHVDKTQRVLENRLINVNGTLHFRWKFTECTEQVDIYKTQQHIHRASELQLLAILL